MAHKLKKNQFEAVRKELINGTRTQADLAADYQISSTMVSVVNNARTWGNYLAGKKAKHPLRGPVKAVQPTKFEKAQKAGLNPVSSERRIEDRFAAELDKIRKKYQTQDDATAERVLLEQRIRTVDDRSDVQLDRIRAVEQSTKAIGWSVVILSAVVLLVVIFK